LVTAVAPDVEDVGGIETLPAIDDVILTGVDLVGSGARVDTILLGRGADCAEQRPIGAPEALTRTASL
jgi:hypothetical protein